MLCLLRHLYGPDARPCADVQDIRRVTFNRSSVERAIKRK